MILQHNKQPNIHQADTYKNKKSALVRAAVASVLRSNPHHHDYARFNSPTRRRLDDPSISTEQLRDVLGDVLISSNHNWKQETLQLIDQIWSDEAEEAVSSHVSIADLHRSSDHAFASINNTNVVLWQGDLTLLQGDRLAIVNAANDQGLGCFVPQHSCLDNVLHRRAGPRLRLECHNTMNARGSPLLAGTPPIVTSAYHLPSSHIIHVTGPQAQQRGVATVEDHVMLSQAYALSLNAANEHPDTTIQAVAFPCISTGLFGFPPDEAAYIALTAVQTWIEAHPDSALTTIVFNVFSDADLALYQAAIPSLFLSPMDRASHHIIMQDNNKGKEDGTSLRSNSIRLAKQWIDEADAVLVCAGAGMSVKEGEMVYTNPHDFANAYPAFASQWGYKTAYQCMGLFGDLSVPLTAKWAFWAQHMQNLRWAFRPDQGYQDLKTLIGEKKDYFILTSNVDACFERSGMDPNRIYTPQGEWTHLQCTGPCQKDSVFETRSYLDRLLPHISEDGHIPVEMVPKCPRCGSDLFGNVRGGGWFLHTKYQAQNTALQEWMQTQRDSKKTVAIVEIGAGFNTPTVTRFLVESFARALGPHKATLIRINPTEAEVPSDLRAIAIPEGWQVLEDMVQSAGVVSGDFKEVEEMVRSAMIEEELVTPMNVISQYRRHFGHFDWQQFLQQLRDH